MSSRILDAATGDNPARRRLSRRSISRPPPSGSEQSKLSDPLVMMRNLLNFSIDDEKSVLDREQNRFSGISLDNDDQFEKLLDMDFNGIPSLDMFVQDSGEDVDVFNIDEELDFDTELKKYDNLHQTIKDSDEILENLEKYLTSFQIDLGSLSSEMQYLQNRSVELTKKLEGRRALENKLSASINDLVLPPNIIRQIVNGEINPSWMKFVKYIRKRMTLFKDESNASLLPEETKNQIILLSHKIVERARDFIIVRIKSLRTSQINSQSIQRNLLLYKDLYSYIKFAAPELSLDLRQAYVNTMRWYYSSHFHRYLKSLEKLKPYHIDKSILLGSDDSNKRGLLSYGYSRTQQTSVSMMEYLNIAKRASVVDLEDHTVILAKNAEENATFQWMETGFRSFNLALLDNGSVEYQFLSEFFEENASKEETNSIFNEIFAPTFEIGQIYTKELTEDSLDAYGVLICIRLSHKFLHELQHRMIPVMEDYFNYNLMIFWPKFQLIMDAHCESMKRASAKSSSYSVPKGNSGNSSGNSLGSVSLVVVPHHLTQVFASFLMGLLILSDENSENEPLANSVMRLRNDFESFLTKVSASISDSGRDKKTPKGSMREKFLFNNYSLIYTILNDLTQPLAETEKEHFKLLMDAYNTA